MSVKYACTIYTYIYLAGTPLDDFLVFFLLSVDPRRRVTGEFIILKEGNGLVFLLVLSVGRVLARESPTSVTDV